MPWVAERRQDVGGAVDAGGQVAALLDQRPQVLRRPRHILAADDAPVDRLRVGGLGRVADRAVLLHEGVEVGLADLLGAEPMALGVVGVAEAVGDLGELDEGAVAVRGVDDRPRRGREGPRVLVARVRLQAVHLGQREPVAEVGAGRVDPQPVGVLGVDEGGEAVQRVEQAVGACQVAVTLDQQVDQPHVAVRPAGGAVAFVGRADGRDVVADRPFLTLRVGGVLDELPDEAGDVEDVGGGRRDHARVAEPAEPLRRAADSR